MKKVLSTVAFAFVVSLVFGQLKVVAPNGDVGIGTSTPTQKLDVDGNIKNKGFLVVKSGASASALFNRTDRAAMSMGGGYNQGSILFDQAFDFQIRKASRGNVEGRILNSGSAVMTVDGSNGYIGIGTAAPTELLSVNGDASKPGGGDWAMFSDKRLKKNINKFTQGIEELMQINPVTYQYNGKANIVDTKKVHVGVIAQEIEEVAPYMVKESVVQTINEVEQNGILVEKVVAEDSYLSVDATAIRYMLVNAVKEHQEVINSQAELIAELTDRLNDLEAEIDNTNNTSSKVHDIDYIGGLDQNVPNPFNGETTISYILPKDATNSSLQITDMTGKVIKVIQLDSSTSKGQVSLKTDNLAEGTYNYTLVVDGSIFATKKMISTK